MAGIRRTPTPAKAIPLRYRIDPTAKKLDDLDTLELELDRNRVQYDIDYYYDLKESIVEQREAIHKKLDKRRPPMIEGESVKRCYKVSEKAFGWVLFILILFWFYMKNKA